MLRAVTSPLLAGVLIAWASAADAITYGQRDCTDNATNTGCDHPNTVSLSGFRLSQG